MAANRAVNLIAVPIQHHRNSAVNCTVFYGASGPRERYFKVSRGLTGITNSNEDASRHFGLLIIRRILLRLNLLRCLSPLTYRHLLSNMLYTSTPIDSTEDVDVIQ